jgi:hypothetical protein
MSRRVGKIDKRHQRLKLFTGGTLVVHICDHWKHVEILHIVPKINGAVYVGKQMSNIHVTGTSYIKIEFLTSQTSLDGWTEHLVVSL